GIGLVEASLEVHGGEVVAIAGIAGNGQSELFDAISGERSLAPAGAISLDGTPCAGLGVTARRRLGAAFVPAERIGHAAVPGFTLSQNVVLTRHSSGDGVVRSGLLRIDAARALARRISAAFDVRKHRDDPEARSLSGGNLQKF